MEDYSRNLNTPWTHSTFYASNGQTVTEFGSDLGKSFGFTHTGFGPGDGVNPTVGSFTKTVVRKFHGSMTDLVPGSFVDTRDGNINSFIGDPYHASGTMNSSYNKALGKLYDKIRGDTAGLGEDIGERNETLSLLGKLRHPIRTFGEVTRDFARAQKKGKKTITNSGSAYLTYAFGVAPLLDDIQNLTKQLDTELSEVQQRVKVRAAQVNSDFGSKTGGNDGVIDSSTYRSHRTEFGIRYFVTDPHLFTASKVGLTNPILTAYQLTTASFLVDWVWNLGDYLDKCENALGFGLSFHSGYQTTTTWVASRCTYSRNKNFGWKIGTGYALGHLSTATKQRTALSTFPFPEPPGITNPFKPGGKRLLSAAALLTSLL
jgi:hypothetical protein